MCRRRKRKKRQKEIIWMKKIGADTKIKNKKNGMAQRQRRVDFKRDNKGELLTEPFAAHFRE